MREYARRIVLGAIAGLFVLSIPWYRSAGEPPALWFGLPDWVAVAVACYVGIALLNCVAWLLTDVIDGESPHPGDPADRDAP